MVGTVGLTELWTLHLFLLGTLTFLIAMNVLLTEAFPAAIEKSPFLKKMRKAVLGVGLWMWLIMALTAVFAWGIDY